MAVPMGFDVPFNMSAERGCPAVVEGDDVLDRSIRTIVQTVPGERPFHPTFGCWVSVMVFANMNTATAIQAADEVRRAILAWEKRVDVRGIQFSLEENTVYLTINWRANGKQLDSTTTIGFGV